MKIRVDSDEYKCWHEVGHATVCMHLDGDVAFIEFLDGHGRGHARTRCDVAPDSDRNVACGGFAAEFFLVNNGYAEQGDDDEREISRILFHNATHDCEDYWGRELGSDEEFTAAEKIAFMHHAIGPNGHGGLIPIFIRYLSGMQDVVRELCEARRIEGSRIRELLRIGLPR